MVKIPRAKNPMQTDEEMAVSIAESKNPKVYGGRTETMEANDARISDIVSVLADGIENTADQRKKVSLSDLEAVQSVTVRYIRQCAKVSALPNMSGLAKALGCSRQAIYDQIKRNPDSDTAKWFEDVSDSFGEVMMQAALTGTVAPVPAIFIAKSRFNWRDTISIETSVKDPLGSALSPEEIMEKYSYLPEE